MAVAFLLIRLRFLISASKITKSQERERMDGRETTLVAGALLSLAELSSGPGDDLADHRGGHNELMASRPCQVPLIMSSND